jgi:hypothetical protein
VDNGRFLFYPPTVPAGFCGSLNRFELAKVRQMTNSSKKNLLLDKSSDYAIS